MRIEDFTNFCKKSTKLINMVKYKICTTGICIILFVTIFSPTSVTNNDETFQLWFQLRSFKKLPSLTSL